MLLVLSCAHNEQYIKSLSNDITTHGFINNDCFQCIITAKPDPGIEGLVYARESAHINLMRTLDSQCYNELLKTVLQLQGKTIGDSSLQECLAKTITSYVDKKLIVVTYYNEDFSKTAVIRIFENGLKQKLALIKCK